MTPEEKRQHYIDMIEERVARPHKTIACWGVIRKCAGAILKLDAKMAGDDTPQTDAVKYDPVRAA